MHNFTAEWRLIPSHIHVIVTSCKAARVSGKNRTAALLAATALFSACRDLLQAAAASLLCIRWSADLAAHRSSHLRQIKNCPGAEAAAAVGSLLQQSSSKGLRR